MKPKSSKPSPSQQAGLEVSDTSDSDTSTPEDLPRPATTAGAGRAGGAGLGSMRVSFDNLLPAPNSLAHNASFTTKVTNTLSSPPGKKATAGGGGATTTIKPSRNATATQGSAAAQKQSMSQPAEPATTAPSSKEVSAFASSLQWGRERPATTTTTTAADGKGDTNNTAAIEQDSTTPPLIAEAERKYRLKSTTTKNMSAEDKHKKSTKQALESANTKKLLQDVKKVRSEQQITAMVEYLQAGFIKIETLSLEKRRIKKLIKAWNNSFERKNGRLPTSGERKGHLRELYEEYHQVRIPEGCILVVILLYLLLYYYCYATTTITTTTTTSIYLHCLTHFLSYYITG